MKRFSPFFLLFFVCIIACENQQANQPPLPSDTIENTVTETSLGESANISSQIRYIAIVDYLQIRDTFNTQGKVLGKMAFGQTAEYLGLASPQKDKIKLREKERDADWKKIRFVDDSGKTIIGWIYGGAVISNVEEYQLVEGKEGVYTRQIIRFSAKELSDILGIQLSHNYYYDGKIYYEKRNGKRLKNGQFDILGDKLIGAHEDYTYKQTVELKGNFNYDVPHGTFEQKWNAYEGMTITKISFDNGNCLRTKYYRTAEGYERKYDEENPPNCSSFPAVEERGEEKGSE